MKIAIDINELASPFPSGVKVYTEEIIRMLLKIDQSNEYFLYAQKEFQSPNGNWNSKVLKWPFPFWTYTRLAWEIRKQKPDILFMPIQSVPFLAFNPKKIKIVATVHDLAFLKFPEHFTFKDKLLLNWHTKRAVKMADKIIVPSRATKNDLIDLYKVKSEKIKVIYHGYKKVYSVTSKGTKFCALTISAPYIFFVGTIQPRKNIVNLVKAFEIFKSRHFSSAKNYKLIIAGGKGWLWRETFKKIKESSVRQDIILTGAVSSQELANLYSRAKVFILPSLYEGFGLPILEAFSYGVPVIASNNSSLSEIVGEAGLLINSENSDAIAEAIKKAIENNDLRDDLIKKGKRRLFDFSWEKSAEEHLKVFENI